MSNIILLIVCLLAGTMLRKISQCPANTPDALNGFIIYISLPSLALYHIHTLAITRELIYTGLMAWILFGLGAVFFYFAGKKLKFSRSTIGALVLVGGLGNTSFVGLPMIQAYYGSQWLGVGVVADLAGSFFVLSTLGIFAASLSSSGAVNIRNIFNKILTFPPFLALVAALLLKQVQFPEWFNFTLVQLGGTLTPLALVSVGFQLQLGLLKGETAPLALGLFYKLIMGPAIMTLLYVGILKNSGTVIQVTIFEAAMAPMISAGIVASNYKLNPPLISLMLGIGIPLSFLTLPVWYWLLKGI
ncbi:AEC family transporter [Desulfobacter vibrioformis]|uniref:AEC family transporter n=1 Tax=Desulfobacter vibrioformis TaxID=34031 RepID=UPI000555A933|nr:AEC family transporter [Desulfobacter vibrioformis]